MEVSLQKRKILRSQVVFQGLSFTDYNGRLFKWDGDLYRAIPSARVPFCRDLFNKGIVQELIRKKLFVETEITSLEFDFSEIVLKHHLIPFVAYPHEWCDAMLKDAALLHLDFCLELDSHNLTSGDAAPWNILFDGCQPIFVDFGSIDPLPDDDPSWRWPRYEQFCRFFIRPLRLMDRGHGRIAHWLLHDYERGVLQSDLEALIHRPFSGLRLARGTVSWLQSAARRHMPLTLRPMANRVHALGKHFLSGSLGLPQSRRAYLEQIRQEVESIKLPSLPTKALDCGDGSLPPFLPSDRWTSKHRVVSTVLSDLRPGSVLDISSDAQGGYYSRLAARCVGQVVAFNPNEASIKRLYADAKRNNLPILPLLMDFISPSHDLSNYWFAPASERLRCDLVLALGLIDRLVFKQNIRFDTIVDRLSIFSGSALLVEFIPRGASDLPTWPPDRVSMFSWYTLDNFINALRQRFRKVSNVLIDHDSHVLLLCIK